MQTISKRIKVTNLGSNKRFEVNKQKTSVLLLSLLFISCIIGLIPATMAATPTFYNDTTGEVGDFISMGDGVLGLPYIHNSTVIQGATITTECFYVSQTITLDSVNVYIDTFETSTVKVQAAIYNANMSGSTSGDYVQPNHCDSFPTTIISYANSTTCTENYDGWVNLTLNQTTTLSTGYYIFAVFKTGAHYVHFYSRGPPDNGYDGHLPYLQNVRQMASSMGGVYSTIDYDNGFITPFWTDGTNKPANTAEAEWFTSWYANYTSTEPTATPTPSPLPSNSPNPMYVKSANSAINNSYIALTLVSISLFVLAAVLIMGSIRDGESNKGMLAGTMVIIGTVILLVVGIAIINGFQSSLGI